MENVYLLKQATVKVPTGIRMQVPVGCFGQLLSRSSLALRNITVVGGVIDNDYRGEMSVLLKNNNDSEFIITTDLAIAQLVFLQCFSPKLFIAVPENEMTCSERGNGGFGSTNEQRI
ncbi:deoxyuridine 5'-triphosphate nucleotidohydrolase-like [Hydra vulgaris]|uniref:deoxyuridine 5'-triphosphate nucleotidohydrolase-like n=1 Tax=Hydra vulgaris TaxID=6087 RepID=UPI001F5F4680|nr:deoxyuridine 5'-triphosphate nucleotidohydrolase-like [Hydra vulgaris]